jgi:hypothetical protein
MKKLLPLLLLIGAGCASNTATVMSYGTNGLPLTSVTSSTITLFDAQALVARSKAGFGSNGPVIYVSGLNESSSSSNLVMLLQMAAALAAEGAK